MEIEFGEVPVSETKFTGYEFVNLSSGEAASENYLSLCVRPGCIACRSGMSCGKVTRVGRLSQEKPVCWTGIFCICFMPVRSREI